MEPCKEWKPAARTFSNGLERAGSYEINTS
nr:MAG TPA_asm: hypothetical protein [Caudoviricetes sp.]